MKFVVAGEALVDIVPGGAGGADSAGAVEMPGGSPANVAVTLGRLGRSPALATVLANDSRGRMVKDWLEASGVEVVAAAPSNGRTSTAKVVLDDAGVASYDFDLTWDLPVSHLIPLISGSEPGVFHVGSIATVLAPGMPRWHRP